MRRTAAIILLAAAALAVLYVGYQLLAPTTLVLSENGRQLGTVACSDLSTTWTDPGMQGSALDQATTRANCDEAAASEQGFAFGGLAVALAAGAAGGLLLRRRTAVLTPQ